MIGSEYLQPSVIDNNAEPTTILTVEDVLKMLVNVIQGMH